MNNIEQLMDIQITKTNEAISAFNTIREYCKWNTTCGNCPFDKRFCSQNQDLQKGWKDSPIGWTDLE